MQTLTPLRTGIPRFAKYAVSGVGTNLLAYAAFFGLLWQEIPPVWASGVAYAVGLSISYLINRLWAFQSANNHRCDLPKFIAAYGVGLIYTMLAMALLSRLIAPEIAQVAVIMTCALVIYTCLRIFRFGR